GVLACEAAIQRYGGVRRIALITPCMPSGDAQVRRMFTDCGYEVVNLLGLKSNSPLLMAHESPERLRRAVREVDDPSVELIMQVGTNLAFSQVAAEAERWLDKPVLAVNTCTYWHALRTAGIEDRIEGFGSLLAEQSRAPLRPARAGGPAGAGAAAPVRGTAGRVGRAAPASPGGNRWP